MNCASCGQSVAPGSAICPACGAALPCARLPRGAAKAARALILLITWTLSLSVLGYGFYKAHYWWQSTEQARLYAQGVLKAPTVERIALPDGRAAHALTFYGEDGALIFIEELRRTVMVVGGEARVEIADGDWFDVNPADVEVAQVTLTPVSTDPRGKREVLPTVSFSVDVPASPLTVTAPETGRAVVLTGMYVMEMQVVGGSTVLVDGSDVTDMVDRQGQLTVNVEVWPRGDNVISVLVSTPHHRETRRDIVLFREPMEINLELATSVSTSSNSKTMTVRGKVDAGARLVVETAHDEGSVSVDGEGNFSFLAQFERYGSNLVRIRAKKEGLTDSVIAFVVNYLPTLSEYSRAAWRMDYDQLKRLYEQWEGKIFLCRGEVVAILDLADQRLVMNVGDAENEQLVVIDNKSNLSITDVGGVYDIYADVSGRQKVDGQYLPKLVGRYADVTEGQ